MGRLASNVEKNSSLISGRKNCRISSPVVLTVYGNNLLNNYRSNIEI